MKSAVCTPASRTVLSCRIGAATLLHWDAEKIAHARRQPILVGAEKLPTSFLKHAEDQTVLALHAVLEAVRSADWQEQDFRSWGVIAAPNMFGRVSIAESILRYQQEGAWGISPQLIPHQSLHAMSGTISQALKVHGPNFGVGAEPGAGPDAFLLAAAMLFDGALPGLWVVLTGYEAEWIPAADGRHPVAPACQALALALTEGDGATGMKLSIGSTDPDSEEPDSPRILSEFNLGLIAEGMSDTFRLPTGKWRLSDSHWIELEPTLGEEENSA